MEHTTIATHDRRRGAGPVEGVGLKSGGGRCKGTTDTKTKREEEGKQSRRSRKIRSGRMRDSTATATGASWPRSGANLAVESLTRRGRCCDVRDFPLCLVRLHTSTVCLDSVTPSDTVRLFTAQSQAQAAPWTSGPRSIPYAMLTSTDARLLCTGHVVVPGWAEMCLTPSALLHLQTMSFIHSNRAI